MLPLWAKKTLLVSYGLLSQISIWVSLLYFALWITDSPILMEYAVKTINASSTETTSLLQSFVVNTLLFTAFCFSHSFFARTRIKKFMQKILVPQALERSTYCLISGIFLIGFCLAWQPIPEIVWAIRSLHGITFIYTLFFLAWAAHFYSIYRVGWNEFWGLRQLTFAIRGGSYSPLPARPQREYFVFYGIMIVSLMAIPWFVVSMSYGHLYFCIYATLYIGIGAYFSHSDSGNVALQKD